MTPVDMPGSGGLTELLLAGFAAAALLAFGWFALQGRPRLDRRPDSTVAALAAPLPPIGVLPTDGRRQTRLVAGATFVRRPLVPRDRLQLLLLLDHVAAEPQAGLRVVPQARLDELVAPVRDGLSPARYQGACASLAGRRVDFAILDRSGFLVLAVELVPAASGEGTAGDPLLRETLARAGVPLIVTRPGAAAALIAEEVREALGAAPRPGRRPQAAAGA
jgi:hypothetical protein